MNILVVKNLNYKSIFKDFNIEFEENTFNLVSGSNKCGKTTLIKILGGIIEVKDNYFYKNNDVFNLTSNEINKTFSSFLFNGHFNFLHKTIEKEVLYYLEQTTLSGSERKMKYKNLIKIFRFDKIQDKCIEYLSLYEKIKLKVLCKLVYTPKILLLDNVLDDLLENEVLELLNILKKIGGMTIIASSNVLDTSILFDRLYIIDKGRTLLSGSPINVLKEDSTLNKLGLNLPFMFDLSIKLKYYDLVDDIELDMDRMVNILWK